MSLASNVSDLATAVATEMKSHKTLINGNATDLSALTTTAKSNLVSAINEVRASVSGAAGINDTTASTSSTYSSSKTESLLASNSTGDRARANHTGTQSADTLVAGTTNAVFLTTEKTKLSGIATGATANQTDTYLLNRANHTGTQLSTTISDFGEAVQDVVGGVGFIVNGSNITTTYNDASNTFTIATSATVNSTDAALRDRSTHTGTQSADTLTDGTTNKAFLATERTKLTGIASGATANSTDAYLLARANHTGTQTSTTISDFAAAVDARISTVVGGAPAALDTLNELAAAIGNDANFASTVTTGLSNRLRFDAAQTLTGAQQTQGLSNLGAASATALATLTSNVGDTTTNFVSVFNAGLV